MEVNEKVYDITIIGGGPVGLFTAFYGGMRQASVKIIESLPQLGGQLSALYPEKFIYDIAGFPKVRAQELVNNLKEQMAKFEQDVVLEQAVQEVEKQADGVFKLTTDKEIHYSKTIIITAGNGAFQPRRIEIDDAKNMKAATFIISSTTSIILLAKKWWYSEVGIQQWTGHLCWNRSPRK